MFYRVPVYTNVRTDGLSTLIDPTRIVVAVQFENIQVEQINIMFCKNECINDARFPKECAFYLILFFSLCLVYLLFLWLVPRPNKRVNATYIS